MKKLLFAALLSISFSLAVVAQDKVTACRGVSDDGKPLGAGTLFNFTVAPSSVFIHIKLEEPVGYNRVVIKLYHIIDGREVFDNTFTLITETDWMYFWKEIIFDRNNDFKVYAYKGDQEVLIGTADLSLKFYKN